MSSTYGENLKLAIFGQSHAPAIGMNLDGIPAGLSVDTEQLQTFLNRRAPGQNEYSTSRKEEDSPEFLCGIVNGFTCGAPITAIIRNTNIRSKDYCGLRECPRPGHADYTAQVKYGGFQDVAGGGHFSGRLTAPLCIAGGLCLQWLEAKGIKVFARIASIGTVTDDTSVITDPSEIQKEFPVVDAEVGGEMRQVIADAKANGDSVGGVIQCVITGLPVGLGSPMFGGMESRIAQIIYGIPAVKGLEFGSGFSGTTLLGSQNNDAFTIQNNKVTTKTNNAGGILGGITNGMPIVFNVAIKPTPSIVKHQSTVNLATMEETDLVIQGRHDPCIVPRAVPVVEAAAAIAVFDALLEFKQIEG